MTKRGGVVVAALLVAGACGGSGRTGGADDVPESSGLAERVCAAADKAAEGDLDAAKDAFHDLHGDLHTLADSLSSTDRQGAGELLRAKQRVEGDLSRAPADRLAGDLRELAVAVAATGDGDPPSCA